MANSMFLIHREQGEWAETIVENAINDNLDEYRAIGYGNRDTLSAGDEGFSDYFSAYIEELNSIGKRPDLLIFRKQDINEDVDLEDVSIVKKAIAAIEVRSSSYLANKYNSAMQERRSTLETEIESITANLLKHPSSDLLQQLYPHLLAIFMHGRSTDSQLFDRQVLDTKVSKGPKELKEKLQSIKANVKALKRRDYLSITPKIEDFVLVHRWIQEFGVKHYYLQVFFDKAYLMSFIDILTTIVDSEDGSGHLSIERDVKNQNKTTFKIDVTLGKCLLYHIDGPNHSSERRELDRGRLIHYVKFAGGIGHLDINVFQEEFADENT